jgi:hypothetical protein
MRWAKHIAPTEEQQTFLVDRTIMVASCDPDSLEDGPIDRAMFSLMLEIARFEAHLPVSISAPMPPSET